MWSINRNEFNRRWYIINLDDISTLTERHVEHLSVEDLEMIATTLGITDIRKLLELMDIDDFSKEQGLLM